MWINGKVIYLFLQKEEGEPDETLNYLTALRNVIYFYKSQSGTRNSPARSCRELHLEHPDYPSGKWNVRVLRFTRSAKLRICLLLEISVWQNLVELWGRGQQKEINGDSQEKRKKERKKTRHELGGTRSPDWLYVWKQLTHYAKLLSLGINYSVYCRKTVLVNTFFCSISWRKEPKLLEILLTRRALGFLLFLMLHYWPLLLSNFGYAVLFVNLLLLGNWGHQPDIHR